MPPKYLVPKPITIAAFLALLSASVLPRSIAQSNSSNVTNSAGPSAISNTTGGSNLTYQSNNSYNNEFGFGPGVFCRTPALFVSGNLTRGDTDNYYSEYADNPKTFNDNWNYGGQIGVVYPFGSKILDYCNSVAKHTALDKEISTQLSMIRACASLAKEGIRVDPYKFPLLAPCIVYEGEPALLRESQLQGGRRPEPFTSSLVPRPVVQPPRPSNTPAPVTTQSTPAREAKLPKFSFY